MNLKSTWSALEEIFDILGGYGYPAIDKTAEELGLEPDFFTWLAAVCHGAIQTINKAFCHLKAWQSIDSQWRI